ncbi:MAG: RNA polymerase sigma factor [Bacteroidetes bacterium]|nr:RNA polymerase sigma factor [Bacteroidota bacterium]
MSILTIVSADIEEHIIKGCLAGKREFQKKLYESLAGKMLFVCFRYCKNRDDAEDVMQDGFIKVFKNLDSYKFQGSFEGWVRRIMVNTAINFITVQKQHRLFDDIDDDSSMAVESDNDTSGPLNEKDVLKILHMLPDGYRTVFNMYVIEGYSHKEIGEILGISEGTSKSQLAKGKNHLKQLLNKYFESNVNIENHSS